MRAVERRNFGLIGSEWGWVLTIDPGDNLSRAESGRHPPHPLGLFVFVTKFVTKEVEIAAGQTATVAKRLFVRFGVWVCLPGRFEAS